jgi:hypothetical protein
MQRMKKSACGLLLFCFLGLKSTGQSSTSTLDVVSWNIEWFGSNTQGQGPPDANLQESNVRTILKALNADLYGLVEVVDTMRIRRVRDSLGPQFELVISPFCSNNTTGTGASWLTGQKLAFIYNKNIFTNVMARGLMRNSASAYFNYASGRFPYMLSADVTINGSTRAMNFILIHGKAGSTVSDYTRRRDGAQELKDTLDQYYSNTINLIIGDYNDALDTTICTGCGTTISSFDPIIKDSTDADHYKSLTLPLSMAGQSSMTNFPNVVDNHVISNEAVPLYISNSTTIRTDVANLVVFYGSTTSDHYPVFSQYALGLTTSVPNFPTSLQVSVYPNPSRREIYVSSSKSLNNISAALYSSSGLLVRSRRIAFTSSTAQSLFSFEDLAPGFYLLKLQSANGVQTIKILHTK